MQRILFFLISFFLLFQSIDCFAKEAIKLEIIGVEEKIKKNIESSLDIEAISHMPLPQIKSFFLTSSDVVKKALEPFGYFKAQIRPTFLYKNGAWIAQIYIKPGPPTIIRQFDFKIMGEGAKDPVFQPTLDHLPLAKNQIFSAISYNKVKKNLMNTALKYGYFDATFTQKNILIYLNDNTAVVILHLDTGKRYRFGRLSFNKNPYSDNFLARFAPFSFGEPYDADKIQTLQQTLAGSHYFKDASVNPQTEQKINNTIPIAVSLKPLPARQYSFGLGYGTDTGPRGSAGFEWRRVTTDGQRFKTDLQASQISSNLEANYIIPGKKPATDQYVLTAAVQNEDQTLGDSSVQKIVATYAKQLTEWQQTIALTFQREHFSLEDQPPQTQFLLLPSVTWMRLVQDDSLHPAKGSRISFTLLGTPTLFNNTAFIQTKFSFKNIFPILEKDRVLLRADLSYTYISNIEDLPLSFQFFAGGTQSIRGYAYNSIGPAASAWVGSVEYRRHITGNWYAAAFYDAGNVSDNLAKNIQQGIGVGAVWQSPIGTLELTVAQAQDLPGKPIAVQFSMGSDL